MSASDQPIVHTPGPWSVKRHIDNVTGKPYKTLYESHLAVEPDVCAVWAPPQNAEREANARLIAAAPELLEACRLVLDAIEQANLNSEVLWIRRGSPVYESATDRLQAVIELATGEVV